LVEAMVARNAVQFQPGLSMAEFNRRYGTEDQCHAALVGMRWPDGFACPRCAGAKHSYCEPKRLFQCSACRLQTSARAGTIFHKSRTPLTKWFLAMHLMTGAKNDISGLELARQLAVKWDTAWLIKQKLMEVMRQRNSIYKLCGDVQVDDMPIKVAKSLGNGGVERQTRPLSWSPSKPVTADRSIPSCAAFRGSRRRRSRTTPWPASSPARVFSATGWAASTALPRRA
jgi:hypothetical protein